MRMVQRVIVNWRLCSLRMVKGHFKIKQERVQSEESGESDSEHSSVDDDNRNPFKG